jgi:hypothetical protein
MSQKGVPIMADLDTTRVGARSALYLLEIQRGVW